MVIFHEKKLHLSVLFAQKSYAADAVFMLDEQSAEIQQCIANDFIVNNSAN